MKYNRITRFARFLMYKLGISMTIPAKAINSVPIKECGEPLVDLRTLPELFFMMFSMIGKKCRSERPSSKNWKRLCALCPKAAT